ncbi:MAG: RecX family transcriptional regulator [Bacteroidetes bacterium]|nr:RecX family transcriptional regulator [Bacteroidota bacterium]
MSREQSPIKLSPEQALSKAESYCAYQERCQQEVRDKLYEWGLWPEAVETIIARLINGKYLDEERFAKAFAGGKFRIKKWGRVRIKLELKRRKVSEYCIKQALKEIDEKAYVQTLKKVLGDRLKKIKQKKSIKRNYMLGQYAVSKGFEPDMVWDIIRDMPE